MTDTVRSNIIRHYVLFFAFILVALNSIHAQKEPQYTQYMYNIGSFNPAYVGTTESLEILAAYRAQWISLPGAPRTIRLGSNIPLANEHLGMGFNVISDQLGPVQQTFFSAAFSYQFDISENAKMSFGIDAGGSLLNVDFSKGSFENPGEPILGVNNINEFYPTIGAGFFIYGQDTWYFGGSIPNFLADNSFTDEVASIVEDRIQFNVLGGYVFDLSETLKFKPAFLMNYIGGAPLNMNLSANFLINSKFTVGTSYRFNNAVSGLAGFQVSQGTFLGYSYDFNTNALGQFNSGSHELIMKFYLGGNVERSKTKKSKGKIKQIDTPRFF